MPAFPYSHTLNDAHEQIVTNDAPYFAIVSGWPSSGIFITKPAKRLSVPEARFVGGTLGVS
jgi:hypothetical protein